MELNTEVAMECTTSFEFLIYKTKKFSSQKKYLTMVA